MPPFPEDWLETLRSDWREWTQGELTWIADPAQASSPQEETLTLPFPATQILARGDSLDGLTSGSRRWWSARLPPGEWATGVLIGWSLTQGDWGRILRSWSALLGLSLTEHQAAEGLTEELTQAWDRLKFVFHLIRLASEGKGVDEVLASAVRLTAELIDSQDVFLGTHDPSGGWRYWTPAGDPPFGVDRVADLAAGRSRPTRLHDLPPSILPQASDRSPLEDLLVVPIPGSAGFEGVLGVSRSDSRFSASDVQLIVSAAGEIGLLLEGSRVRASREEAKRLELELSLAGQIQASMLPATLPEIPGVELAAQVRPAFHSGGDLYDVAKGRTGEVFLLVGDVAGKGIGAAMITSMVHASFHSLAPTAEGPDTLLASMNRLMQAELERAEGFVTAAVVRLDSDARAFSYGSAGHVPAAIWRAEREAVEDLPATGLPLGIEPEGRYEARRLDFAPGDVILLYSDGVTETVNDRGKLLGRQGLADLLYAAHGASAKRQLEYLLEAVDLHRGDRPLLDDVALLVVRRNPEPEGPPVLPFVFSAEPSAVSSIVDLIRKAAEEVPGLLDIDRHRLSDDFALAVAEVVSNQVRHAYEHRPGRIQGSLRFGPSEWTADLYDIGRPFQDPGEAWPVPDPVDPPLGGYGLHLVRGLVEDCTYRRLEGERNHWRLVKRPRGGKR